MQHFKKEEIPRPEYPRPQFVRENNWFNLNGIWGFTFDDNNNGLKKRWYKNESADKFDKKIVVPFCYQSRLSGIEDNTFHDIVWYRREFILPNSFRDKRILMHFGAVDYSCMVYLNGEYVGNHSGGYIGFSLDVTNFIRENNVLVLRVEDPSTSLEILRGKQFWEEKIKNIFYPRVTGIWQTVWLEVVSPDHYLKNIKITPDIDNSEIILECEVYGIGFLNLFLSAIVKFENQNIATEEIKLDFLGKFGKKRGHKLVKEDFDVFSKWANTNPNRFKFKISIPKENLYLWDVKSPNLYDLLIKIYNKNTMEIYDQVKTYFGMRKISLSDIPEEDINRIKKKEEYQSFNRQVLLNNKPIYQKLFLIQGYWPDGLYTAPSEEDIKLDIQFVKEFGFNGLRTHQKAFDPIFLYWCDKMGILVWGEIGNAYEFSTKAQLRLINEFVEEIERDYNHPSIIVWVILNEGWGVPGADKDLRKTDYTISLYYLMKSIDPSRLIIDDDGWWHTKTDLCTKHFYLLPKDLPENFRDEKTKNYPLQLVPNVYLKPYKYENEPIIYSEIGGYGFDLHNNIKRKWGYSIVKTSEEFLNKIIQLLKIFDERKAWVHGFCYTELYDIFQEINGLLTFDREPKFPPEMLKNELDKLFY